MVASVVVVPVAITDPQLLESTASMSVHQLNVIVVTLLRAVGNQYALITAVSVAVASVLIAITAPPQPESMPSM